MIEQGIMRAVQDAQKGSKQELQANALLGALKAVKADGFTDPQDFANTTIAKIENEGNASEAKTDADPKLQKEWKKQANKLAGLIARELGLTRKDYLASLPQFEPQPKSS